MAIDFTTEKLLDSTNTWYYYKDDVESYVYITEYNRTNNPTEIKAIVPATIIDSEGIEKKVESTYELFYKDDIIEDIEFSEGITQIGSCTCYKCDNLTNVKFPNALVSIENYSFWNCDSLESVEIPDGVSSIEEGCFCDSELLRSVNIPLSVSSLSSFVFRECPNLVLVVDKDSYGLEYCINNDLPYKLNNEAEILTDDTISSQFFLAGVANVDIFKNNTLFSTAKTLIDSSITIGVSAEDIRAGQGAKLYGKYFHTSTFDLKLTDAMFRLEYLAANVGADLELGGDVFYEEELTSKNAEGEFNLLYTPRPMTDGGHIYIYWKEASKDYYNVKDLGVNTSNQIKIKDAEEGKKYCIKYLYTNNSARKVVIKANFTPDTLSLVMNANLYSGDVNNPQTGTKVGIVTIKVPRFLLNGSQEISLSMTGAANTPLEGSALASKGEGCDGDGIYAEIIEVINGRTYNDLAELKIQNSEDELILYVGETYRMNVYGRFKDSYFAKINNTKLDITSTAPEYVSVDSTGLITAKQKTYGVIIPVIAGVSNNQGEELKYDVLQVVVK